MKKLSKFIYFIFAFALITCMAIFNPAITFADASEDFTENVTLDAHELSISTKRIKSSVKAGEQFLIPMPTVSSNAKATSSNYIIVTDRNGKEYTYNCTDGKTYHNNEALATSYFTRYSDQGSTVVADDGNMTTVKYVEPNLSGKGSYYVKYMVKHGDKTYYSNEKLVQVTEDAYSWEFNAENQAKNIIPSITQPSTDNQKVEFVLPLPKLINNADKLDVVTYDTSDIANGNIVIMKGIVDVTDEVTEIDGGKVKFVVPELNAGEKTATYTIKYKTKDINSFAYDRSYTVKVDANYKNEAKLEVTHDAINNVQVGAPVTFPTANVTDKTHNKTNVEVNTTIIIKDDKGVTVEKLEPNRYDYRFDLSGSYTVYYEVEDAYGNKITSAGRSFSIRDEEPYLVTYANSYVVADGVVVSDVEKNADYLVQAEVGYGGFWLPAIYAEDYVNAYKDITFTRELELSTDSKVTFNIDTEAGNAAYDSTKSYNDRVFFKFPETADKKAKDYAGSTFYLKYSAKGKDDTNSNRAYATTYQIKIANVDAVSYNIDKGLVINFPTINNTITPGTELEFTSATAKEEKTNTNVLNDERVEVRTYYYYGDKSVVENAYNTHITEVAGEYNADIENTDTYNEKYGYLFDEKFMDGFAPSGLKKLTSTDGKTTINLEGYTNQPKVTIFAVAINDQGQFVIKAREVAIDATDENHAPYIVSDSDTYDAQLLKLGTSKFEQNMQVTLPTITFTDDEDSSLQLDVHCYVNTPDQTVGVTVEKFLSNCGIEKATLTTTYAGTYYVVYTATDDAGNTITYVSTFEVANTEKAYIEVENGSNISKFVGEDVVFNVNLVGEGEYEDDYEVFIDWGENKPSGTGRLANSYTFDKAGTYVATIKAKYDMKHGRTGIWAEPSVTVTVTIKEPTLSWSDDVNTYFSEMKNSTSNKNDRIDLAVVSATEEGAKEVDVKAVPTVKFVGQDKKEKDITPEYDYETQQYYFITTENGVYTVTYTATTDYDSKKQSYTITCGDYYEPTVTIGDNQLQDKKITFNGKDITLKVKEFKENIVNNVTQKGRRTLTIVAMEGDKELFSYDIQVTIEDTNITDNGKVTDYFTPTSEQYSFELTGDNCTSDGNKTWKITGVGSYELKLTVKDANGNATTRSIEFTVANKTEPKKVKDNVVGIVLIVVSVVVLGGVILFFALAGKRNKKRRPVNKD